MKAFSLTNEELAEEKTGHQDYEECKLACRVSTYGQQYFPTFSKMLELQYLFFGL